MSTPARSWSRMASWVASSKVSLTSVWPYSSALILSRAVQNQPGKPWLPITCVGIIGSFEVVIVSPVRCRESLDSNSEQVLLDLAHRGARERLAALDELRHLEGG